MDAAVEQQAAHQWEWLGCTSPHLLLEQRRFGISAPSYVIQHIPLLLLLDVWVVVSAAFAMDVPASVLLQRLQFLRR